MITATATGPNGEQVLVLGITRENVKRLKDGQPIHVDAVTHPGVPAGLVVVICYGDTERDLVAALKPMIGEDTKVVAAPKDHPSRSS